MRNPGLRGTMYLDKNYYDFDKLKELKAKPGIADIYINETEGIMVVKYDKEITDEDDIRGFMLKACRES
jgi:type IV secretory pathway ATPase VirB11/archaellum biosynthesis ATPase